MRLRAGESISRTQVSTHHHDMKEYVPTTNVIKKGIRLLPPIPAEPETSPSPPSPG